MVGEPIQARVYWLSGEPDEDAVARWADDVTKFVRSGKTQQTSSHRTVGTMGEMVLRAGGEADPREGFDYVHKMIEKYVRLKYRK